MSARPASLSIEGASGGPLTLTLAGDWRLGGEIPALDAALARLEQIPGPAGLRFDGTGLGRWDSTLLTALLAVERAAAASGIDVDRNGLPDGVQRLLGLATKGEDRRDDAHHEAGDGFLSDIGIAVVRISGDARRLLAFLGNLTLSVKRLVLGRAVFDGRDFVLQLKQTGADALPIVSLISFLVGVIFAFVGVMQLERFGAGIYVADLVAVAMVREIAAIMTAIIMAGRSGAAFAAELGTMKVNEEIDALRTLGLNVMDYLVLPRALALVLMMPLLTLYANLLGILGGLAASLTMLDVSFVQYLEQTKTALGLNSLLGGLFKALVYGIMVAVAGCQQGMACGNSALAVGRATTAAVVMAIVLIVVSASVLTVIYTTLDI